MGCIFPFLSVISPETCILDWSVWIQQIEAVGLLVEKIDDNLSLQLGRR